MLSFLRGGARAVVALLLVFGPYVLAGEIIQVFAPTWFMIGDRRGVRLAVIALALVVWAPLLWLLVKVDRPTK